MKGNSAGFIWLKILRFPAKMLMWTAGFLLKENLEKRAQRSCKI